jgi:hypothetical protein
VLRIVDLWWEEGFDPLDADGFVAAFGDAIRAHAEFTGATRIGWPRSVRHRAFVAAVRGWLALTQAEDAVAG